MLQRTLQLAALAIALSSPALSQVTVSGVVTDSGAEPQSYANVLLLHPTDSSLVRGAITEEDGVFSIEKVTPGGYILLARSVGYQSKYSPVFEIGRNDLNLDTIVLSKGVELDEVKIVARKPLYEQKIDRMVVNVASSITSAGATALEVLERSPGVTVNRQNNTLSLVGKDGVVVMINGKVNYMPTDAIVQMLAGMSADNIERIELITTPPAKYDAEGNAGFINIVLRQNSGQGTKGSYTFSGGYSDGPNTSANLNFNHRQRRVSLFGSYTFLLEKSSQFFTNSRLVVFDGAMTETTTLSDRDPTQRDHNARLGIDLELSDKTVIGAIVAGYDNKWTMDALNNSSVLTDGALDSSLTMLNIERNQWQHYMGNFNIQHALDEDHTLTFDADFLHYRDENPNTYEITNMGPTGDVLSEQSTRSDKITPIDIAVGKIDYTGSIGGKLNISSGAKAAISTFTNRVSVERFGSQGWVVDPQFTASSNLTEKIYAAYTSFEYDLDEKTGLQLGLRYEYTDSNLDTDETPNAVDREFGTFFPSAYISRDLNENHSLSASFSRRITRPTFNDMAPFVIFFDPTTFFSGNTALQPAIANSVKLDYRYKSMVLSLQYTHEDSTIARFQDHVDLETNRQTIMPLNMKSRKTFTVTAGFPVYITHWWEMQNNFILLRQQNETFYESEPVKLSQTQFRVNTVQSFKLTKDLSAEISAFYNSKTLLGAYAMDPSWSVNAGIAQNFGEQWGTLRLSVEDVFDSMKWEGGTFIPGQSFELSSVFDFSRRTVKLTYSRHFGQTDVKGARKRSTGSEEERARVQ